MNRISISTLLLGCATIFATSDAALATSPWFRARGEAVELQRSTRDLRNRLERIYPYSAAGTVSVHLDEQAKWFIKAASLPLSAHEFEHALNDFARTLTIAKAYVATDHRIASDSGVCRYLDQSEVRFGRFVADLRRAKVPVVPFAYQSSTPHFQQQIVPLQPQPYFETQPQPFESSQPYSSGRPSYEYSIPTPSASQRPPVPADPFAGLPAPGRISL